MGIFVRDAQAEKTIHGVLINMNWVWEQYLQSILEDEIKGKGWNHAWEMAETPDAICSFGNTVGENRSGHRVDHTER